MKVLGIDIGTTTISAAVCSKKEDGTFSLLDDYVVANKSSIAPRHPWEHLQDANAAVRDAKQLADELLLRYPDIRAIGLTGQMHGITYVNKCGQSVSPLYTWQDERGSLPGPAQLSLTQKIFEKTHLWVPTGYGLLTHLDLSQKGALPKEGIKICTIADYAGMVLTGRREPLLHASMAASLGFYDVRRHAFQTKALELLGADPSFLPDHTKTIAPLGTYQGIPVSVSIGDNQASFLGSIGCEENTLLLNIGTGGQVSVLSREFFETEEIETRPFLDDTYLLVASSLCGGRSYAILEHFFWLCAAAFGDKERTSCYEIMDQLAREGRGGENPLQVRTTFQGTRTDPSLRAQISNISETNFTPQNLTLGVLRGMADELAQFYEVMQKGCHIRAEKILASGNGLRKNPVLQEICEERFGCKLFLTSLEEEAACGAAKAALRLL